ncbi:MAG: tetratricopeptide repeat protein [Betaproteobacteria bacterium]|nr:tetratricopeptide repeat protein [Betaproteobacteria bacterium]
MSSILPYRPLLDTSDTPAAIRLIAAVALSLFFVAGIMPASSHAQPAPQTNDQEESRIAPPESRSAPSVDIRGEVFAQKLYSEAVSIERESPKEAVARYDELMQRFGRASNPSSRQYAIRALLNKGGILSKMGNDKEAISTYERIERNFGNEKTPAIREVLASAFVSKAESFYKQGDIEKALDTYTQLERQFDKDDNDFIKRLIDIIKWRVAEIRTSSKIALSSSR